MKKTSQKSKPRKEAPVDHSQPTIPWAQRSRYFDLIGLVIIILVGTAIYSNSFDCSFHLDDVLSIVDNTNIRDLSDVNAWWNGNRPLAYFTFALNYHFNQLDVWYWHFVNLAIHLTNACLVYWLSLLIFSTPAMVGAPISGHKKLLSLFTALLFVSHPLATQSVTYIVQRMASMAAMFYLLSLALYVTARLTEKSKGAKYLLFALAFISGILALLTKEHAFTLPFALLLFELFFLQTKKLSFNIKDRRILRVIALLICVISVVLLKFSFSIFKPLPEAIHSNYLVTSSNYLLSQFSVIVKYIQLLFLPVHQNLDYDYPIATSFFEIRTLLSFLFLSALVGLAVFLFNRNRIISFGIFWFFLTISIESSIIPILDLIFEHRTYLPSFGFFLVLSTGIYGLVWKYNKNIAIAIFLGIIGLNAILTYQRNKIWKDDITLWSDVVSKAPGNARAYVQLGTAYNNAKQWEKAIPLFKKAIEIKYKYSFAHGNLGSAYVALEQWDKAIAPLSKAIEMDPTFAKAYTNRGLAYRNLGQREKSIADYTRVIEITPDDPWAYWYRGLVYIQLQQWDKAIADNSRAIEINPKFEKAYTNRGTAYSALGKKEQALSDFSSAIEINPQFVNGLSNRAIIYYNTGQFDNTISDCTKAIELEPNLAATYNIRGLAYLSTGQLEKSIEDFNKAISLDPKLSAAYSNRDKATQKLRLLKK